MKKTLFILTVLLTIFASKSIAQIYFSKDGFVRAKALRTGYEDIITTYAKYPGIKVDFKTGEINVSVLIKSFKFERALMEEHFNENFSLSSEYQVSKFKGKFTLPNNADITKDGIYTADIAGKFTLRGVTKDMNVKGIFLVEKGKITAKSSFKILLTDYGYPVWASYLLTYEVLIDIEGPLLLVK